MDHFDYKDGELYCENVPVREIAAQYGTPCYIYSRATLERHWHAFNDALEPHPHLICYSLKANSNLAILNVFVRLGSGFDVVSGGELARVDAAGGDTRKVVFSGVGKTENEIRLALELQIKCFNVESRAELARINQIAGELKYKAPISIRINPDVDAKTHPYISTGLKENKFGIAFEKSFNVYLEAKDMPNIDIKGIDCHIGSQLTDIQPFMDAIDRLLVLVERLKHAGIELSHIDLGGGLGVRYHDEKPPHPSELASRIKERLIDSPLTIMLEPGRAIVANAGILISRVEYLKHNEDKDFAIVDAGMNDLLRPSLYNAWHTILNINEQSEGITKHYDIVGPVCETGDFFAKERELTLAQGDILAIRSAGAYGSSMSSHYNSRPKIAEVMVDGSEVHVIREREEVADLYAKESILP